MKRFVAAGVAIALSITTLPAKANPALLAPAAGLCSTGVGCILIGTVIIGGVAYYVYTHQGKRVYVPKHAGVSPILEDPDEEMDRMGNNASQGRVVRAKSVTEALNKCAKWADGRKTDTPQSLGNSKYKCRYS